MAPTKSAGRVSIRVLPDSSKFREDLKKTLDRIENSMKVSIPIDFIVDRKQLAALKKQIEELKITVRPDIDLTVGQEEIERIKAQIEAMDPEVQVGVDLDTTAAATRMAALTRDRMVSIWPIIHAAAVNNFTRHLAAISGASFISQEIEKGLRFLRTIDIHAVQLAKQAAMVGTVIAMAGGAVQAIMALGDGIIQTLGILTVAPALLSSIGIAVGVFAVVLKDMKTVLADLGPAFTNLQDTMSAKFWEEAAKPIRELTNHLMPTLIEKMNLASVSMGKFTGQMANSYKEHVTIERFGIMFDRVLESMETVRGAVDPLMEAFMILGMHGTQYLNRLSKAIVKMSENFRDWIKLNDENGNLHTWTENAIQAFKDLGGIMKGVWDVFGAVNDAIKAAGGPNLKNLHEGLDRMARTMESPMFQTAMTGVFRGINRALGDMGRAIKGIGPELAGLAPTIERAFVSVGGTMSTLIGYFGEIISHPAVKGGISSFFESMEKAAKNLAPSIEPFSIALGSLLKLLGTVLENVAALVNTIMVEWGPSLQKLSDTFDTLAEPLRLMLEDVVRELTPAIEVLINRAIIPLLEWMRDDLIPAVSEFANVAGPALVWIIEKLGQAIDLVMPYLKDLTDWFKDGEDGASGFEDAVNSVKQLLTDPVGWVMDFEFKWPEAGFNRWWDGVMEDVKSAEMGDPDLFIQNMDDWFADVFFAMGRKIKDAWNNVDWNPGEEGKQGIVSGFDNWFNNLGEAIGDLISGWWDGLWGTAIEDAGEISLGESDGGVLHAFEDWLSKPFKDVGKGISEWWDRTWNDFRPAKDMDWVDEVMGEQEFEMATAGIGADAEALSGDFANFFAQNSAGWSEFWGGAYATLQEKWGGAKTWFDETTAGWSENFNTWMGGMGINTTEGWEGIKTSIGTKIGEAKDNVKTKLDEMGVDTTTAWSTITSGTQVGADAMKKTVGTKIQETKDNLKNKLRDMGIDVDGTWANIKGNSSTSWQNVKDTVSRKAGEISSGLPTWMQSIPGTASNAFNGAKDAARNKMQEMKDSVKTKVDEVVNDLRNLPQRIITAIQQTSLYQSGRSLLQGFINGIRSMGTDIANAASNAVQRARDFFPFSPAKKGPFSGQGWTKYSGMAVVNDFADGMASRMGSVASVAHTMTKGVAAQINGVKTEGVDVVGTDTARSGNVNVNIYNPVAEPSSRTIARASSTIKLGGAIG